MFIRYTFSQFIESNTNFKNQSNFSLFIHIYEHKKQLLKTMFNICSTSSNMWIWSYDHPPQDRFTRCALDAKYDRAPASKTAVRQSKRVRPFSRSDSQKFNVSSHAKGHFTTLPPPPPQPGRVEPDISSLWMDLFSLDSVIFVVDFSDTSHDKCWK